MYQVEYYSTEKGEVPVKEFVEALDEVTEARFLSYVKLLEEHGPNLTRPYADMLTKNIRELRPRRARVFYFFAVGQRIILVHGILKKDDEIPKRDIELAEKRRIDWLKRNQ